MKISYAITVCNELEEIQRLVLLLLENKRDEDEIVVLYDDKHGDEKVEEFLEIQEKSINSLSIPSNSTQFSFHKGEFNNHFADWKNQLTSYCSGDYIFQIDADEYPQLTLIENLPSILESNPDNHVFLVPRINTVDGLTQEHIQKWRWNIDSKGRVNWPDYQWRIWKNTPEIKWINKVHERLDGFKTYAPLPDSESLALHHPKDIKRQEKQNNYYNTL